MARAPELRRRDFLAAIPVAISWGVFGPWPGEAWADALPLPSEAERKLWHELLRRVGTEETAAQNEKFLALVLHFRDRLGLHDILSPNALLSVPHVRSTTGVVAHLIQRSSLRRTLGARFGLFGHFAQQRAKLSAGVHLGFATSFASIPDRELAAVKPFAGKWAPGKGAAVGLRVKGTRDALLAQYQRYLGRRDSYLLYDGVPARVLRRRVLGLRLRIARLRWLCVWIATALARRLALDAHFDAAGVFGAHPVRPSAMRGLIRAPRMPLDPAPGAGVD